MQMNPRRPAPILLRRRSRINRNHRRAPRVVRMSMNRSSRPIELGLFALLAFAACSQGEPTTAPTPAGSSPVAASPSAADSSGLQSRCPNQNVVLSSGERAGGEVEGDVDGDGAADLAYVVRDESGDAGCQTFLVVETDDGILAAPTEEPGVSYALPAPRVNSLVQVDGSGGLEVLVDLEQGASTQFLGMFKVTASALEKVRIAGGSAYGDLFPYGGSVGHIEASNCTEEAGADVLIAQAIANATDYSIRTVLYELRGTVLRPLPRSEQPPIAIGTDVESSDGFSSSPFGDCSSSS